MSRYVVWGCGDIYNRYKKFLEIPGLSIAYLVDGDENKHGNYVDGYVVKSPRHILKDDVEIIIAVKKYEEIAEELLKLGFTGKSYTIWDFPDIYIEENRALIKKLLDYDELQKGSNRTAIFDIIGGLGWAGTEMWAYKAATISQNRNINTVCFGSTLQQKLEDKYEQMTVRFDTNSSYVLEFLKSIASMLPVSYFCNFWGISQEYAFIAKKIFQDDIYFAQVFHSDMTYLYDEIEKYYRYMDMIWCVSKMIAEKVKKRLGERFTNIQYQIMSYTFSAKARNYSLVGPVKIGVASRLVKEQKRIHLLPEFISRLVECNIYFEMNIAGEGELKKTVEEYIEEKGWQNKVRLLGLLSPTSMQDFWTQQDIFLSLSSYEGTSLSMLEAMSSGCVPVVTDVSGVKDVVADHINGIVSDIDDLDVLIDGIAELAEDRNRLVLYGKRSVEIIANKCDENIFADFLIDVINRGDK